jgi:hypothetical protein
MTGASIEIKNGRRIDPFQIDRYLYKCDILVLVSANTRSYYNRTERHLIPVN